MRRPITDGHRCQGCRMLRALCICTLVPRMHTRTHLVLVLHQLELGKPTNTGRLAVDCLPNSRVVVRGAGNAPVTWPEDATPVLLFPHEDAEPIERWRDAERPVALVVPDGTWSQAIRVRRRVPGLADVPAARLPDGIVSRYRLRHDPRPGHVSTLEAIAAALRVLERDAGEEIERRLLDIEQIMVERTLWSAGKLRAPEVMGGIPEPAIEINRAAGRRGGG